VGTPPKTPQRLMQRTRIVLGCAGGMENRQVARQLRITDQTRCKWRERFRTAGLDGPVDKRWLGAPRKITDVQVEAPIGPPWKRRRRGAFTGRRERWRRRPGCRNLSFSASGAFSLQPHQVETFELASDPFFVENVRDIVGLYLNPPWAPWCCVWTRRAKSKR
jgi:hypothetical protein